MTDDELYLAYVGGDPPSGDALMLRHGDALTAYLSAFLHSREDAEDMMLDCFAALLVNKPRIGEGRFRAYLYRMARNRANSLWRLRFRRRTFRLDEETPAPGAAPEEALASDERSAALARCLNRIAPQYREALYLVYDLGMSYAQAGEVLGCGGVRVENLLKKGKMRMREELEKEGITRADL